MMPKNKNTWSSWNFIKNKKNSKEFTLSYWMNNLQKLKLEIVILLLLIQRKHQITFMMKLFLHILNLTLLLIKLKRC